MNIPFINGEHVCEWCGKHDCETLRCMRCGYDFNICKLDPRYDPDCPNCGFEEEY